MFRKLFNGHTGSRALQCAAAAAAAVAGLATGQAMADAAPQALCIDKLACHRNVAPPQTPTVLVSCGSFNPPTIAHLRMFDLATAALAQRGYDVWGCYMSPVADAYGKKGLAPVQHRLAMCRLAAAGTDNVMLDAWEAAQPGYTRTLQVLRHVASSLAAYMQPEQQQDKLADLDGSSSDVIHAHGLAAAAAAAANLSATADHAAAAAGVPAASSSSAAQQAAPLPRVMLLCGADLLATINQPGVWKDPDIILQDHGIVCVCRAGTDVEQLLQEPGGLLQRYKDNVIVVEEPVNNAISSTTVRQLLADKQPVRYLVPDAVLAYIHEHALYSTA